MSIHLFWDANGKSLSGDEVGTSSLEQGNKSIHPFEFKDPQEDPSGFIAWMWQIEPREKYKEAVQEIIKWIISGCDLHADNLSENAKKLLRRHVDKKNFLAKSKTFYPFF